MIPGPLATLFAKRSELERALANVDAQIARAFDQAAEPVVPDGDHGLDDTLTLDQAAVFMAEPRSMLRRRPEYLKARVSAPGARRIRFSRRKLEAIREAALADNGGGR